MWALLFALLAASLVRMFAPYACGSGIPEVAFRWHLIVHFFVYSTQNWIADYYVLLFLIGYGETTTFFVKV